MKILFFLISCLLSSNFVFAGLTPSYCALPSTFTKVLYTYPKKDFLDNIAWLSNPVPNQSNLPYLISFSQFMDDGNGKNYILDLATGEKIVIPGQGDPVVTPDGKFLTIPGAHSGKSELQIYLTKEVLPALLKKDKNKNFATMKPVFVDKQVEGYCQSFGVLRKEKGTVWYRLLHTEGGKPFSLTEYEVTGSEKKIKFKSLKTMQVCSNLPQYVHDNGTAILSKDGNYISLYDSQAQATKIFELQVDKDKCTCKEVVNLGIPTGRVDFSYDTKKITFHVNFLDIDYADNYVLKMPSTKIKDAFVADLEILNGKIVGLHRIARLTVSQKSGEGSYFPTFLPNGKIFYVYQDNSDRQDRKYRFEVVDPSTLKYESNIFSKLNSETEEKKFLSKVVIGRLWTKSCGTKILTPVQSALYAMSLDQGTCKTLVKESWTKLKSEVLKELKEMRKEPHSKLKAVSDKTFNQEIRLEDLFSFCG
ncbi:hypothetical protein HZA26_03525 [Candidatus Nomurabacteria bacterium]|nr:hypothetical protein [Candidatus Nomurabacteria bacterium]